MDMRWRKKGLIFCPEGNLSWAQTHAQVPLVQRKDREIIRIYYGTRDKQNRTRTSYIEVKADDPSEITYVHPEPVLHLGEPGFFDDSGVMPSDVLLYNDVIYLYYVGWNTGNTARYRTALGLALSRDGGKTFQKVGKGPIIDRDLCDPVSISCQSTLIEDGIWKTWYMSYVRWEAYEGFMEPFYEIKYAESDDGVRWHRANITCIALQNDEGGIACPAVIKENQLYRMWYSVRKRHGYRKNPRNSYRIGYAESKNGMDWVRLDDQVGITVSRCGWDSEMIAYPFVYCQKDRFYLFYNGNGFGKSGFGYAVCCP